MEPIFDRHFTLEEANALIPAVREVFARVAQLLREPDTADKAPRPENGNGRKAHRHPTVGRRERAATAEALLRGLAERGIVIQDWQRGLIDFPHLRDGREVFLCYEPADGDQVLFFHDIEAGFAGRQPL
jgi:hypothetical protein